MEEFNEKESAQLMDAPIPGVGLTTDPENPRDWETPPDYNNLEDFVDDLFMNITREDNIDGVLDPIRKKIPIEDVAQVLLFQAMAKGKISTDLLLGAVEPTIYMLIGLSEYAGIRNPVLYPEDEMLYDAEDEITELEEATKGDKEVKLEKLPVPKGVSRSLAEKIKAGEI